MEHRAQLVAAKSVLQHLHQATQYRCVCCRKQAFGIAGQLVDLGRSALTTPHAVQLDEAIAFERGEVRSDSVVGEAERDGKVVDGPSCSAQKQDDLAAGRFEE